MAEFPNTRLSVIERIRVGDDEARREALGVFINDYRPALIAFLVKAKRVDPVDADDLVNDFILNKIIKGKVLELARDNGRFRSAMRTCIQRYLIDSIRKRSRDPISPDADLDQMPFADPSASDVEPLDRVWAIATFTSALSQMKRESDHWELFVGRVLTQPPVEYDTITAKLGYENPQKASNALMTAKRSFNRILSACMEAQAAVSPSVSDVEIANETHLLRTLLGDTDAVRQAIESMVDRPQSLSLLSRPGAVENSNLVFVDFSPDATWSVKDAEPMFAHLLDQPIRELGLAEALKDRNDGITLGEILDINSCELQRVDLLALKEHFNRRGKSGSSDLPRRIDVAITFALICRHILAEGRVEKITSLAEPELTERIQQMTQKPWLPLEVKTLFETTVRTISSGT